MTNVINTGDANICTTCKTVGSSYRLELVCGKQTWLGLIPDAYHYKVNSRTSFHTSERKKSGTKFHTYLLTN